MFVVAQSVHATLQRGLITLCNPQSVLLSTKDLKTPTSPLIGLNAAMETNVFMRMVDFVVTSAKPATLVLPPDSCMGLIPVARMAGHAAPTGHEGLSDGWACGFVVSFEFRFRGQQLPTEFRVQL